MMNCNVYDLGKAPLCGLLKLPFPANGMGNYYILAEVDDTSIMVTVPEITNENPFFWVNANELPVRRDIIFEIYKEIDDSKEIFNLTRNIGTDCVPESETACFSKFRLYLQKRLGVTEYSLEFPTDEPGASSLLYYDIRFITGNEFVSTYALPDFNLYTTVSVNASLRVWVDGVKYYWNDNIQDFSDQFIVNGNTISFLEDVNGGRVEVEFYDNLILK